MDSETVVWASTLPEGTSAQKAELIALTQALRLAERKINIYMDSRYAFATAHVHGAIYWQCGWLTSAWFHASHIKAALHLTETEWRVEKTSNPLKLHVCRTSSCPGDSASNK